VNAITLTRLRARKLKVLVVDDNERFVHMLRDAVEAMGYLCAAATDGAEAWEIHKTRTFDVILSDWIMPRQTGLELCQKVRAEGDHSYTYFILLTCLADSTHMVRGLDGGADEYLTKPILFEELEARLAAASRVVEANRKLLEANRRLQRHSQRAIRIAQLDPLTQLNNRLGLGEGLSRAMEDSLRDGLPCSVALCDIDHFKQYNDTYGHIAGDTVLKRVAEAMRSTLRQTDWLYRYGGEEFLAVLPEQTLAEAGTAMERMRRRIQEMAIPHEGRGPSEVVTASTGVAQFDARIDESAVAWLERADAALYGAKDAGRNCVGLADQVKRERKSFRRIVGEGLADLRCVARQNLP